MRYTIFLFSVLMACLWISPSWACSCLPSSIEEKIKNAFFVFRGIVIKKETIGNNINYRVRLTDTCNFPFPAVAIVVTASSTATCGVDWLQLEQEYIFTTDENNKINLCGWVHDIPWLEAKRHCPQRI